VNQRLSCAQRLNNPVVFERALNTRALTDKWLAIHVVPNEVGFDRLGIVISKRNVPKAVGRNRIKRQIREIFRLKPNLHANSFDIVVRIRRNVLKEEMALFQHVVSRLLKKVRIAENDTSVFIDN
jgi:ribonuclease P protein component